MKRITLTLTHAEYRALDCALGNSLEAVDRDEVLHLFNGRKRDVATCDRAKEKWDQAGRQARVYAKYLPKEHL